jgi:condensin-2 complex subunit G2
MHDSLIVLEADSKLQDSIAGLCELWWHNGLEGKQSLISQSLPFLINKSLDSGRKADVKRVYGLREALMLFDFQVR